MSMSYGPFLDACYAEREAEIKPQLNVGCYVNLMREFGDIWHEVKHVFDNAVVIYHQDGGKETEYIFIHSVRKVSQTKPKKKEARIIYTRKGEVRTGKP